MTVTFATTGIYSTPSLYDKLLFRFLFNLNVFLSRCRSPRPASPFALLPPKQAWTRMLLAGQARGRERRASTTIAAAWRTCSAVSSMKRTKGNITMLQVSDSVCTIPVGGWLFFVFVLQGYGFKVSRTVIRRQRFDIKIYYIG